MLGTQVALSGEDITLSLAYQYSQPSYRTFEVLVSPTDIIPEGLGWRSEFDSDSSDKHDVELELSHRIPVVPRPFELRVLAAFRYEHQRFDLTSRVTALTDDGVIGPPFRDPFVDTRTVRREVFTGAIGFKASYELEAENLTFFTAGRVYPVFYGERTGSDPAQNVPVEVFAERSTVSSDRDRTAFGGFGLTVGAAYDGEACTPSVRYRFQRLGDGGFEEVIHEFGLGLDFHFDLDR